MRRAWTNITNETPNKFNKRSCNEWREGKEEDKRGGEGKKNAEKETMIKKGEKKQTWKVMKNHNFNKRQKERDRKKKRERKRTEREQDRQSQEKSQKTKAGDRERKRKREGEKEGEDYENS